jgi:plasmid stabilization system protein ParE
MISSRQIDLHPEAVAEAQAAAQWYRERSVSAAHAFLTELDRAIEKLRKTLGFGPAMLPVPNVSSCNGFLSVLYIV